MNQWCLDLLLFKEKVGAETFPVLLHSGSAPKVLPLSTRRIFSIGNLNLPPVTPNWRPSHLKQNEN